MQWKMHSALWISVLVLLSTSVGVIKQLQQKSTIQCACLGTSLNLPMTEATLIENLIMLSMSVGMLLDIYI